PEFFFAPGHIQTRSAEIGAAELMLQMGTAYVAFRQDAPRWLRLTHSAGPSAVEKAYREVLAGRSTPDSGQIVSMHAAAVAAQTAAN
ncbi:MAG: DUF2855 family protein, partial [Halioglobus sp.]|nr:DUF2855 family protein [Halioglobus sp.]